MKKWPLKAKAEAERAKAKAERDRVELLNTNALESAKRGKIHKLIISRNKQIVFIVISSIIILGLDIYVLAIAQKISFGCFLIGIEPVWFVMLALITGSTVKKIRQTEACKTLEEYREIWHK